MAVTAKFQADFDSFYSAVQKAELSLKSFESGAGKVESSLNKMADSLSGRKLIQDASLMAEAVNRIGGTSKLTQEELSRVASKAAEAVTKLKALGIDVPPGIAKIASETKGATGSLEEMKGIASSLAGAFGIAFSVGAAVNFGRAIADNASNLVKLSAQTGLTIEEVQKLSYVASQNGNSLEQLTTAVGQLQDRLNDPAAQAALKELRINFEQFKGSGVYQQIELIADGMGHLADKSRLVPLAKDLFGKTGVEDIATLTSAFRTLADQVVVSSEAEIKAIDRANNRWQAFKTDAEAAITSFIGKELLMDDATKLLSEDVQKFIKATTHSFTEYQAVLIQVAAAQRDINLPVDKKLSSGIDDYRKHLLDTRDSLVSLSAEQKILIELGLKMGDSQTQIAAGLNLSTQAVGAFITAQKEATDAAKDVASLEKAWHDLYFDMHVFGAKMIHEMTVEVQKEMAAQRESVMAAQLDIVQILTKGAARLKELSGQNLGGLDAQIDALNKKREADLARIEQLGRAATDLGGAWASKALEATNQVEEIYQTEFNNLVSGAASSMNGVSAALGSSTVADAAKNSAAGITSQFTAAFQSVGSGADAMAAHIASVLGAITQTEAYRAAGFFVNPGFGTADTINRHALNNIGRFANGVQNYRGGTAVVGERGPELVNLPGGSSVVPNGGWGGGSITVAPGAIVITGQGAASGREAAAALLAHLKSLGVRL